MPLCLCMTPKRDILGHHEPPEGALVATKGSTQDHLIYRNTTAMASTLEVVSRRLNAATVSGRGKKRPEWNTDGAGTGALSWTFAAAGKSTMGCTSRHQNKYRHRRHRPRAHPRPRDSPCPMRLPPTFERRPDPRPQLRTSRGRLLSGAASLSSP